MTCARPISAPSGVTIELLLMFCALNGATETPWRTSQRQMPAVTTDLPASDVVPATSSAPLTTRSPRSRSSAGGGRPAGWGQPSADDHRRGGAARLLPPDLLLPRQRVDLPHDPVGHLAARLALAGLAGELGVGQRLAEGHRDPGQARPAGADGLHLVGARDRDRDHRAAGGERQPGDAGLAAGQLAVAGARAL